MVGTLRGGGGEQFCALLGMTVQSCFARHAHVAQLWSSFNNTRGLVVRIARPTSLAIWHRGCSHRRPNRSGSPNRRHFASLDLKKHPDFSHRRPTSQDFRRRFSFWHFPLFSGKVQIVSRTFLVGALNRPRKRKGTNRENPRTIPEQIGKIPEKSGKSQKGQKRTKKEGRVQIGKPPRLKPPRLAALNLNVICQRKTVPDPKAEFERKSVKFLLSRKERERESWANSCLGLRC